MVDSKENSFGVSWFYYYYCPCCLTDHVTKTTQPNLSKYKFRHKKLRKDQYTCDKCKRVILRKTIVLYDPKKMEILNKEKLNIDNRLKEKIISKIENAIKKIQLTGIEDYLTLIRYFDENFELIEKQIKEFEEKINFKKEDDRPKGMFLNAIYGDTDSIYVSTKGKKTFKFATMLDLKKMYPNIVSSIAIQGETIFKVALPELIENIVYETCLEKNLTISRELLDEIVDKLCNKMGIDRPVKFLRTNFTGTNLEKIVYGD